MHINISEEGLKDTLLSHLVIHALVHALPEDLVPTIVDEHEATKGDSKDKGVCADIVITANGHELNLESFVEHWGSQVSEMIKKEAAELVSDKFREVTDLLFDLNERVQVEVDKRLEDWEKESDELV